MDSQFNYASLIWMFCHKATYLKMQKIYHKSLKVIYQSDASYNDLLQLSYSVSLHQWHLRFLLTEIYKSTGTLNPQFMWSYFKYRKVPDNLRRGLVLFIPTARFTIYGTNSVHFLWSLIWNRLPNLVKSSRSIYIFAERLQWLLLNVTSILLIGSIQSFKRAIIGYDLELLAFKLYSSKIFII